MYPCPRCLIPKNEISKIGTEEDRRNREKLRRIDSVERQGRVEGARKSLYEEGYAVSAKQVDGVLKDGSLVPTKVGRFHCTLTPFPEPAPECVLTGSVRIRVRLFPDAHR